MTNGHSDNSAADILSVRKLAVNRTEADFFNQTWRASIYGSEGGKEAAAGGTGQHVTWAWRIFILVQIKDLNIESVVTKESSFYYCLNWINLFESGTVSVSVTGSEMTDSELSLLAVVSRCWSMDSMIGSVCTQNVKWETHLKGWSLLLFTLCSVLQSEAVLNMICRLIFLAGSCLASVIWPLLILWSITLANNQNERFLSPCLHRYIYYWHHPNCQVPNPYWPNCPGALCTSATFTTWMKLILVTPTSLISTLWNALDAGINRADVLLRLE